MHSHHYWNHCCNSAWSNRENGNDESNFTRIHWNCQQKQNMHSYVSRNTFQVAKLLRTFPVFPKILSKNVFILFSNPTKFFCFPFQKCCFVMKTRIVPLKLSQNLNIFVCSQIARWQLAQVLHFCAVSKGTKPPFECSLIINISAMMVCDVDVTDHKQSITGMVETRESWLALASISSFSCPLSLPFRASETTLKLDSIYASVRCLFTIRES